MHTHTHIPSICLLFLPSVAFVADIGEAESANTTVTRVLEASNLGLVDSVVINGDISYATGCESKGCTVWDAYCRMASPLASSVPWQVSEEARQPSPLLLGLPPPPLPPTDPFFLPPPFLSLLLPSGDHWQS
jgi:hypothetical protein